MDSQRSDGWRAMREVYKVLSGVRKANTIPFLLAQEEAET